MSFTFIPNPAGLYELLESPVGDTAQFIFRLAGEVAALAKANCPKVTGTLANSITVTPTTFGGGPAAFVTAEAPYAAFVHEGAAPHPIDPVQARVLRFPAKSGMIVFTPHVDHPGNAPNPFLTDALIAVVTSP